LVRKMRQAQIFLATIEPDAGLMKTLAVISILAAYDFRGGLYRPAFHGRSADNARDELNSPLKHLGDDSHALGRQQCFRLINS
jgi:hypothetical protein